MITFVFVVWGQECSSHSGTILSLLVAFPVLGLGVRGRTEHEDCILADLRARPLILQEGTSQGHVAH